MRIVTKENPAALRRRKERPPELLMALRYERALVYEELGQRRRTRSELERLYAEDPDYEDVAERLGVTPPTPRGCGATRRSTSAHSPR